MSFNVVGVGEVLWDLLPTGPQLGGAPANFAYHARALGANAQVISRVGNDFLGTEILDRFRLWGLSYENLQFDSQRSTGVVTVTLQNGVPDYCIHPDTAWDAIEVTASAREVMKSADALCFGTLAQRSSSSRSAIQRLVASASTESLRVFDVNLRQNYFSREVIEQSLRLSNVLKLNDSELPIIAKMFAFDGDSARQIQALALRFALKMVALTKGAQGSLLYCRGEWSEMSGEPAKVVDTIGAGDSFSAALIMGMLSGMKLEALHRVAAEVARHVCSCPGATPPLPAQLRGRFASGHAVRLARKQMTADAAQIPAP